MGAGQTLTTPTPQPGTPEPTASPRQNNQTPVMPSPTATPAEPSPEPTVDVDLCTSTGGRMMWERGCVCNSDNSILDPKLGCVKCPEGTSPRLGIGTCNECHRIFNWTVGLGNESMVPQFRGCNESADCGQNGSCYGGTCYCNKGFGPYGEKNTCVPCPVHTIPTDYGYWGSPMYYCEWIADYYGAPCNSSLDCGNGSGMCVPHVLRGFSELPAGAAGMCTNLIEYGTLIDENGRIVECSFPIS